MNKFIEPRIMTLPIEVLKVDKYQKKLRRNVINNIVGNFDPVALGLIHVSLRNDGTYWIFDGQNRTEALRKLGFKRVQCLVFAGLTYEQEAKAFVGHQNSSSPTKVEEHNGRVEAKDPIALDIDDTVKSLGLIFSDTGSNRTIKTVKGIYDIYNRQGSNGVYDVLYVIRESFPEERYPYKANFINALGELFNEHGDKMDIVWLISRLSKTSMNDLNLKAEAYKNVHGFSKREAIKMAITERYNHNKKVNRL